MPQARRAMPQKRELIVRAFPDLTTAAVDPSHRREMSAWSTPFVTPVVPPRRLAHHGRPRSSRCSGVVGIPLTEPGLYIVGLESALATRFFSAVKTGTSKEMRDNWCLGFSARYTVGVWVGNASGAPMHDVSGITGAAPVWLEILTFLHRAAPSAAPSAPTGLVAASVDFPATVEPPRREWFASSTEPGARTLAIGEPRIIAPVTGTIVALDPDIPADRQRVPLEVAGESPGLRWRIDDTDLGPARGLTLWEPKPGTHTVALVDEQRRERDVATFEVRGGRQAR
jgi:penicillin-binding protein 1C